VNLGDTFVNKPAPGVPSHLWMVLSDPNKESRVVLANISSDDGGNRGSVTFQPGEHPFVSNVSYVRCDKARVENVADVERVLRSSLATQNTALQPKLVDRAQKSLLASPLVSNEAKEILIRQGVTP
jgi:hypothetical protein